MTTNGLLPTLNQLPVLGGLIPDFLAGGKGWEWNSPVTGGIAGGTGTLLLLMLLGRGKMNMKTILLLSLLGGGLGSFGSLFGSSEPTEPKPVNPTSGIEEIIERIKDSLNTGKIGVIGQPTPESQPLDPGVYTYDWNTGKYNPANPDTLYDPRYM